MLLLIMYKYIMQYLCLFCNMYGFFIYISLLSYVHTCAGRLRSGGGRILTFPLRYRGYVHTYAERTRGGRGWICHFLRTMMVWSARFRSGRGKLGVGPISCGAVFAPAPPPLRDRACVNTCNDLCWSQFSARLRPRMCERTLTGDRGST